MTKEKKLLVYDMREEHSYAFSIHDGIGDMPTGIGMLTIT